MRKKYYTVREMYKAINEMLAASEGIIKGAVDEECTFYRMPFENGYFRICVSDRSEGSIIGTYWIDFRPDKDIPETWDVTSGLVCCTDDPVRIVKHILWHIDMYSTHWVSDDVDYLE